MKHVLILILFHSFLSFGQIETNKFDENGKKQGIWKGYYEESKRLRYEGSFEHGKEIGMFRFFDDTKAGTVIATREFNPNDNSCYTIFYNQKNNKVSEGRQLNKLFDGEWKFYHEDSKEIMTLEHYKNGKLEGIRKVFYPNGALAEEANYNNGLKEGLYKKYTEKGIVLEESYFKNNEFDGLAIFKSPDDIVVAKGLFKQGKKVGIWEFNTNGKISKHNYNFQGKKFAKRKVKPEP